MIYFDNQYKKLQWIPPNLPRFDLVGYSSNLGGGPYSVRFLSFTTLTPDLLVTVQAFQLKQSPISEDMRLSMLYFSYGFPDRGMPKQFVTKLYGIAELMGRESIKLVFFHLAYSTYIIGDRQTCITGNVVAPGGTTRY